MYFHHTRVICQKKLINLLSNLSLKSGNSSLIANHTIGIGFVEKIDGDNLKYLLKLDSSLEIISCIEKFEYLSLIPTFFTV